MEIRANRILAVSALVLSCATFSYSQDYRQLSTVHDGSGAMSSGGTYTNWSAGGQPGGIFASSNGALVNYAGFLQAVDIKKPNQTDIYGNPYELTTDNDADGLTDISEVQGTNFSPVTATQVNNPDSDGDGASDLAEVIAETDPTDESINLQILDVHSVGGNQEVTYMAREDKTYLIRASDGSYQQPAAELGTQEETSGGSGDWLVRTNIYTDVGSTNQRSYAIEAQR